MALYSASSLAIELPQVDSIAGGDAVETVETRLPASVHRLREKPRLRGTQSLKTFSLGPGLSAYLLEFSNAEPYTRLDVVENRLEVAVLLAGETVYGSSRRGVHRLVGPKVFTYQPGEMHNETRRAVDGKGLLVGFRIEAPGELGLSDMTMGRRLSADDPFLVSLARAFAEGGEPLDGAAVGAAVRSYVLRNGESDSGDALARALSYLEERSAQEIYVSEVAGVAEMRPRALSEAFRLRYGAPPIAYLVALRIRDAKERLLASPSRTVTEVALQSGFAGADPLRRALHQSARLSPRELRALYESR